MYYYSGLKNYSEILEKYDKLNFIIKYYEKFKMGLGLQRLTEFKANYKTELNLISHPKFNEYNYLSYLPSNTSENILSLRKNQLIYFDKTDKILLPTSKGISINSIINKSINFYEDLLKINTINSKIIELST